MTLEEIALVSRALAPVVADLVAPLQRENGELRAAVDALRAEVVDLRARSPEKGAPGEDGRDGRDAEPLDPDLVKAVVESWLEAHPTPAGKDGLDGEAGPPGKDGRDAEPLDPESVKAVVESWLEAHPAPAGKDGLDGIDGEAGRPGKDGAPGADGRAAPELGRAFKDDTGQLVLTLSNGDVVETGIRDGAPGRDGAAGKDGRDGLEPDQILMTWGADDRSPTFKFVYGDTAMVIEAEGERGAFVIDRGAYKATTGYDLGDAVTHAGQYWIAQAPTSAAPGGNDDWRLAVRKGRDGRDGKDGEKGADGRHGKDGRDGRDRF